MIAVFNIGGILMKKRDYSYPIEAQRAEQGPWGWWC